MPFSPTESLGCRMTIFNEYSAGKVEELKPIESSECSNFVKSSEDVCNLFSSEGRGGCLQSLNLFFLFEFGILKKINSSL